MACSIWYLEKTQTCHFLFPKVIIMENAYTIFLDKIDKFRQNLRSSINNPSDILLHLNDLHVQMMTVTKVKIITDDFVETHKITLFRIYNTLTGSYRSNYFNHVKEGVTLARSVNDIFFKTYLGINNPKKRFSHIPTLLATGFCKGITYFKTNNRSESCGQKDMPALNDSKTVQMEKKTYLRKCYIERFIYNDVYTNVMHEQDVGHLVELQTIERLYQDYFPVETLAIKVTYNKDYFYPQTLTIISINSGNTDVQEYSKQKYYSNTVQCKRLLNQKEYVKTQTFYEESAWIAI
jgi:hypothetical protein